MTTILGLSFDYHDAAAALLHDGTLVAAAQEERFTRRKNDPSLPSQAARFCLSHAGLQPKDVDFFVFYEDSLLKFDRISHASVFRLPPALNYLRDSLRVWLEGRKFFVPERICEEFGIRPDKIIKLKHHQSHAASAFYCSPFENATVVTIDGVGEHETATVSLGEGTQLHRLASVNFPHSLGLFYSAITAFLGFEVNEGEYKVMGMAAFGAPRYAEEMLKLFSFSKNGEFKLQQKLFTFDCPGDTAYTTALTEWLGPPRAPESEFDPKHPSPKIRESSLHYADVAASAQKCTEEVVLRVIARAIERTGCKEVCFAGGVALNSVANFRLKRELGCNLFVQPAAGDAGGALGAALYQFHGVLGKPRRPPLTNVYLGPEFSNEECLIALKSRYIRSFIEFGTTEELIEDVAAKLSQGSVVGWFQGRSEWGPRSLGCRSILAHPGFPNMQAIVNEKIKFREKFRPFAPSATKERAGEFFEIEKAHDPSTPAHFMLEVCKVRPEHRKALEAVTHVDGTARIHLVDRAINPIFHQLIERFGELTGIPVLLNTSFNRRGEPIVNSPDDAIENFLWTNLDFLVLGRVLVEKKALT